MFKLKSIFIGQNSISPKYRPTTSGTINKSLLFESTEGSVKNILSKCDEFSGTIMDEKWK